MKERLHYLFKKSPTMGLPSNNETSIIYWHGFYPKKGWVIPYYM